ncbi:MAG: molybdopterin-guanine dinucleotide biosynthesis protein B [Candidatus Saccharicenans sp.]|uniref:molybdopterin-guanine dinucleotide biosynthesis protein B n=1 Tax=Candidatus Saccharicenans sp. TaxID=2819258 RepID=UPI0040499EDD
MRAVAIIGASDTGKTTLITALIEELNRRGLKCGVLKKASHEIELDAEGKDSWRFMEVGARSAAVLTEARLFIIKNKTASESLLEVALDKFSDVDLLLVEGGKRESAFKKILRVQNADDHNLISPPEELIAIVSDEPFDSPLPFFLATETAKLSDFLMTVLEPLEPVVKVKVDGKVIPLNPFVQGLFAETIRGMVRALKGVPEEPSEISLKVRKGKRNEEK